MFHLCCQTKWGKPADVKKALLNVVPHSYGEHESCGKWYGYLRNPGRYKHATLLYGRDLTDLKLKKDLKKIFENFADRSEELAPSESTQANEAINSIVGSKAPNIRHYGDSESSDFRCAAAVCEKNEGHSYIQTVQQKLGIKTDSVCLQHRIKLQDTKEQYFNLRSLPFRDCYKLFNPFISDFIKCIYISKWILNLTLMFVF